MTEREYRCECCGRRLRADEGKGCRFCVGRIREESERLKAGEGPGSPLATQGQPVVALAFAGSAVDWDRYGSRVIRKAAMRGDSLRNPAHRARLQAELHRARRRDHAMRVLGGRGGGVA
ncbi:MAG: hypothetical protein RDU89_06840 [bacterium]|nr:hypothetical protein [bacterium]